MLDTKLSNRSGRSHVQELIYPGHLVAIMFIDDPPYTCNSRGHKVTEFSKEAPQLCSDIEKKQNLVFDITPIPSFMQPCAVSFHQQVE